MSKYRGVGSSLTTNNRLSSQLMMPDDMGVNNGSTMGGLAYVLQQAAKGLEQGRERRDQEEATQVMKNAGRAMMGNPEPVPDAPGPNVSGEAGYTAPSMPGRRDLAMQLMMSNDRTAPQAMEMMLADAEKKAEAQQWEQRFGMQNAAQDARFDKQLGAQREDRLADRAYRDQVRQDEQGFRREMLNAQRAGQREPMVQIVNPVDGKGMYVPQSEAYGAEPYAPRASFQTLSPEEISAIGLPPGSVAQRNSSGQIQIINKPAANGQVLGYTADGDPITAPGVKPMNNDQANAALYADRIRASEPIIEKFGKSGTSFQDRALSKIPVVGNSMVSQDYQQFDQAQRDFINAVLRRESGAAIASSEFDNANRQYFPQPGDSPEVIQQKANNRAVALGGIARAAGPAYQAQQGAQRPQNQGGGGWSITRVQ